MHNALALIALHPDKFRRDFYGWIKDNWHIYEYFEKSAFKVSNMGFNHYSARTIIEVMRHRSNVREISDTPWKLNDQRTPDLSRLFTFLHPDMHGFFEQRERTASGR